MDYAYTLASPVESEVGENGFGYRRAYFTSDFAISEAFSSRIRLEAADNKPAPFIKDLYLKWSNSFAVGHDVYLGISPPPSFTVAESVWGYRSLEKTIQDRVGVVSSRDFGVAVRGRLDEEGTVRYGLMVANNSGTKAEEDKDKRVYAQVEFYPAGPVIVTLGGDYTSFGDGEPNGHALGGNALAAIQGKGYAAGIEGFVSRRDSDVASVEGTVAGVSLFGRHALSEQVSVVARFDRVEWTGNGSDAGESYAIGGVAFRPHMNVEFIPNIWVVKIDEEDSAFVNGRLTAYFQF